MADLCRRASCTVVVLFQTKNRLIGTIIGLKIELNKLLIIGFEEPWHLSQPS